MKMVIGPKQLTGILLLVMTVVDLSWYYFFEIAPLDVDMTTPGAVAASFAVINENRGMYLAGLWDDFAWNFTAFLVGWGLYLGLRDRDQRWALLGGLSFVAAAITYVIADAVWLGWDSFADQYASASGAAAESLKTAALALSPIDWWADGIGSIFFSVGLLAFSLALRAVTGGWGRWLWALGLVGAVVCFTTSLFDVTAADYLYFVNTVWYALTGVWLLMDSMAKKAEAAQPSAATT